MVKTPPTILYPLSALVHETELSDKTEQAAHPVGHWTVYPEDETAALMVGELRGWQTPLPSAKYPDSHSEQNDGEVQDRQLLGHETQMAPLGKYFWLQLMQLKMVQVLQFALQLVQTLLAS